VSAISEQRLSIAGYETRAVRLEGDGPQLLLLHGWSDSADTWRPLFDRLARRGQRAVALDLPGFGTASHLDPAEAVLAQLDRFLRAALVRFGGEEPAVIVGNSLGGCAALRAAQHPAQPIAALLPIAPAGLDMAGWIGIVESERLIRLLLASPLPLPSGVVRTAVGQVYRQIAFARPFSADPQAVASFTRHVASRADVARILASGRRLRAELVDPFELERITCPVLVVWGDSDRMVFSSGADRILREVPGARLEVIEECGHCPQIEAPDRLAQLVEDLMREAGLAGSAPLSG
jgi:pimeloyl-ACP methyl ester carboxylesterase